MRYKGPLGILITAAVPLIILGNALIVMLVPWMADAQYALPGFPDDPLGLSGADRSDLAETGIRSIWPLGDGTGLLEQATLPGGEAAFQPKEIRHMEDVSGLVRTMLIIWLLALAAAVAGAVLLRRLAPSELAQALGRGAWLTLALMALTGLLMLVSFDFLFNGFHQIFFEADTWQFADSFTLRRLYPDAFWGIAAGLLALAAFAQALVLAAVTTGFSRPKSRNRAQELQ